MKPRLAQYGSRSCTFDGRSGTDTRGNVMRGLRLLTTPTFIYLLHPDLHG